MLNNTKAGTYKPMNINQHVPLMAMTAGTVDGVAYVDLGAPNTLDLDGILDGVTVGTSVTTFDSSDFETTFTTALQSGLGTNYGRALTVTGASSGDQVVTITGKDYLGQVTVENFTISGTTPIVGKKAFYQIDGISATAGTGGVTMDIGWNDILGLPYKGVNLDQEYKDDVVTSSGTFVAGAPTTTTQTATTADSRGTFDSNTASNGSVNFEIRYMTDNGNLHGNAQFSG